MLSPCVLMRATRYEEDELRVATASFPVYRYRTEVPAGSLVVGRYANLPYHRELEQDIQNLGSRLINTTAEHNYVANFDYYEDLADVTFPTWFRAEEIPFSVRNKPLIVKGRTNSRKQSWGQLMYAPDFVTAGRIAAELRCDGLLGQQGIIFRQYEPLEAFEISAISGLPFANEWRIFYYKGTRLAHGYYWSGIEDWSLVDKALPDFEAHGLPFADAVAQRLADKIPFVVIDVAKTAAGVWRVVELNDGCQAGLNDSVPADTLYANLRQCLNRKPFATEAR